MPARDVASLIRAPRSRNRRLAGVLGELAEFSDPEWPPTDLPATVHCGLGRPRTILYLTKWHWFSSWVAPTCPPGLAAVERPGLLTPDYAHAISFLARQRPPISFVGDVDPVDIAVFLSVCARAPNARIRFGITPHWIDDAMRHRQGHQALPAIAMREFERGLWDRIRVTVPEIVKMVAPECVALLDSGRKLEIEGLVNPAFYDASYPELVRRHLRIPSPVRTRLR